MGGGGRQACILVFANKQDLREAMSAAEMTEILQLHQIKTHEVLPLPILLENRK